MFAGGLRWVMLDNLSNDSKGKTYGYRDTSAERDDGQHSDVGIFGGRTNGAAHSKLENLAAKR